MLSFASPIWLAGLLVVPLIWWLHRFGDSDAATPVSAVFLFYNQADDSESSQTLPRADPLWILRAVLLSLLFLALARSFWPQNPERHISVWFDDSLSMHTIEEGQTRTAIAAQKLAAALDEVNPAKSELRMLGDHRERLDVSALAGESRRRAINRWAGSHPPGNLQIPLALPAETENWLVWDGADQHANSWAADAGFSRTIKVGSLSENTAITALMARRTLERTTPHHGSVRVNNLGTEDSKRTLTIRADGEAIHTEDINVTAGDEVYRSFRFPTDAARVTATLMPADALALDDTSGIALDPLQPVAVDLDSRCGSHFSDALNAHPGLQRQTGVRQKTALAVLCAPSSEPLASASISVHTSIDYQAIKGPVQWQLAVPGLDGVFLDRSWLLINPHSSRPPSALTLLSAPDMKLSLIDAHTGIVDVFMDIESAPIVERPEYPLLVNALVELALERPVLDPVVSATRNPAESRIAGHLEAGTTASSFTVAQVSTDLTPFLLILAALLLLADILFSLPAGALNRNHPGGTT